MHFYLQLSTYARTQNEHFKQTQQLVDAFFFVENGNLDTNVPIQIYMQFKARGSKIYLQD